MNGGYCPILGVPEQLRFICGATIPLGEHRIGFPHRMAGIDADEQGVTVYPRWKLLERVARLLYRPIFRGEVPQIRWNAHWRDMSLIRADADSFSFEAAGRRCRVFIPFDPERRAALLALAQRHSVRIEHVWTTRGDAFTRRDLTP